MGPRTARRNDAEHGGTPERRSRAAFRLAPLRYSFVVKLTIHSTGTGTCLLTGKESSDGLVVTFDDQTVKESFLSWRAFRQLLGLKTGGNGKPESRPIPPPPAVGQPVVVAK